MKRTARSCPSLATLPLIMGLWGICFAALPSCSSKTDSGDGSDDGTDDDRDNGSDSADGGSSAMGGSSGGGPGEGGAAGSEAVDARTPNGDAGSVPADATPSPYATCIMPVGDSITQGDVRSMSYRYWLWKTLKEGGYKAGFVGSQRARRMSTGQQLVPYPDQDFDVDHEAYWGKTPGEILANMAGDTMADKHIPGVVLLHAGTNEVWTTSGVSAEERAEAGLEKLIDHLRSRNPRVTIFLAKIISLHPDNFVGFNVVIEQINEKIGALAARKTTSTSAIKVVDQAAGFGRQHFSSDGIHPNEAGEKQLAMVWWKALEPVLAGLKDVPCPL